MGDFTTAGEVESVTAHEVINNIDRKGDGIVWAARAGYAPSLFGR